MVIARKSGPWVAIAGLLTMVLAAGGQAEADGLSLKDQKPAEQTERGVWFGGYDVVKDATYAFDGVIVALNRDLSKDGWALRAYGSRVDFDQNPTGDGRGWQGDVMLGYLFHRRSMDGGIYIGADYQNYRLSPDDPTSHVRGTEWGFKVAGDITTSDESPLYLSLEGSYSTAFNNFWSRARVGHNRSRLIYGIEGQAFGDESFLAQRLGAFLTFQVPLRPGRPPLEITLSGGHQFVRNSNNGDPSDGGSIGGGEGTYGTIVFSMAF
jgi:cellulose biosynthesis protein BcsS